MSNVTQVFFGVNELETAEYVSNRLGEQTIIVDSGGTSRGTSQQHSARDYGSYSTSSNSNQNWKQHGRKFLKPEEVMALSPRTAITFAPGVSADLHTIDSLLRRAAGRSLAAGKGTKGTVLFVVTTRDKRCGRSAIGEQLPVHGKWLCPVLGLVGIAMYR